MGKRSSEATKTFLKLARDRFDQAIEAEKNQRARELADLQFYAGDQWPADISASRAGLATQDGLPPVPARPCITINKTKEPVRQVLNQERQSDMGIEIVPADDFGELVGPITDTEIQLREGLTRRIQRESKAADARTWAFARAVIAGRGFYGVMTRYVPGKTNDQEVYVERYYNQACVTIDPAHEQPDGSDAEWGFIGADLSWGAYKAEHGQRNGRRNAVCDATADEFRQLGDAAPDWFRTEGETRSMRVVNYFYTERATRELVTYQDGTGQQRTEWADEMPDPPQGWIEVEDSRRPVIDKTIKWAKFDGCDDDVLEETDWPGPDMPIVKVLGEELQPYDTERRVEGMVRAMREPGYGFNVMVSRWIEMIGLSPLTPLQVPEGGFEGYEAWYQALNTRTLPYLPFKVYDDAGRPIPPPTDTAAKQIPIEPIAASVQMFDQAIQSTSGIHNAALGQADASVRSKKQAQLLVEQSHHGSNHYLDNLQRSMRYEGQIINNLLYPIYGRPGRLARILNAEGEAETVLLHQPMVMRDGKPVAAPDDPQAKQYTLTKDAQFNVIVKVSKNYDSRREQEREILGEMIAADPALMTWFGDLFFANQDGPGHQQMADRAKVMLAPPIQQTLAAKAQGKDLPPEVQAQLSQKDQQIQQLQAELQKASAPGAVEQIKQAGAADREHRQLLLDREKMHLDAETKIAVAELGAKVDRLALFLEERARVGVADAAAQDRAHQVGMAAMGQGHEADQAAQARAAAASEADAGRTQEAELAQRAQDAAAQAGAGT